MWSARSAGTSAFTTSTSRSRRSARSSARAARSRSSSRVSSSLVWLRPRRLWTKIIAVGTPANAIDDASCSGPLASRWQRPATSATAGSTSPASPPPGKALIPTSTTTAPAATNEAPTSPARPAATTSTSAVDVTAARSTVREWHTVTVASRASSSCATGLPTTAERPTTTARRPLSATSYRSSSASTAAAVAGAKAGSPVIRAKAWNGTRIRTTRRPRIRRRNAVLAARPWTARMPWSRGGRRSLTWRSSGR